YNHMLLTEVFTFFFLSLFVFLLTVSNRITIRGALYLCVAITAGFYYRSSLLYLAPLLAIIYCLPLIPPIKAAGLTLRSKSLREAFVILLIVGICPFLLAYPWQRYPNVSTRAGDVLLYGLVKSSVLPFDDPIL